MSGRPALSREAMLQIATHLLDIRRTLANDRARGLLASCAAGLEGLAADLPPLDGIPMMQQQEILAEAREVSVELGIPQRSATMLLAILLTSPGEVQSVHRLAGLMGISTTSVRVFACTLRKWLAEGGIADAIGCRWGVGYVIEPGQATLLEAENPPLARLVSRLRDSDLPPFTGHFSFERPGAHRSSDPFLPLGPASILHSNAAACGSVELGVHAKT